MTAVLAFGLAGCGYQDFQRPLVRNYARDLFPKPQRPPEAAEVEVQRLEDLAQALARWKEMTSPRKEIYTVGLGDVLKMSLFTPSQVEADIVTELEVSAGGAVWCPLLGDVAVTGLTTAQLEEKLAGLYSDGYYRDPLVKVTVSEYRSKQVLITGAAANPGVLTLKANRITFLEALLQAGGLIEKAGDSALVTRVKSAGGRGNEDLVPNTVQVNVARLIEGSDMAQNIWIYPGDVIHILVAEDEYFFVLGYVRAPGAYPLPRRSSVGVMDAIAWARGLDGAAQPEKTYLVRSTAEGEKSYRVDLTKLAAAKEPDITLQSGDKIIVRTSWGRRTIDGLLHTIGLGTLPASYGL